MLFNILIFLSSCIALFYLLVWLSSDHPEEKQNETVICPADAPLLGKSGCLTVMSWNIQFMAGSGYHFWFEPLDDSGPDKHPSKENLLKTVEAVAALIKQAQPDIILLQEVDEGAKRTGYTDQLQNLLALLPETYSSHTSCFYWKTRFLPHPKIMGSTGMKLSIISKYKIKSATRHSLPLIPQNWIVQQLGIKQAILEARIAYKNGGELVVMNTHLEAYSQGYDTLQKQVEQIKKQLLTLDEAQSDWIIGGDFNLLPAGQYPQLDDESRKEFQPETELQLLYDHFSVLPSKQQLVENEAIWLTYLPNEPSIKSADRTLDYLVHSNGLKPQKVRVNQTAGFSCSDHAPLSATFKFSHAHDSDTTQSPA